MAYEQARLLRRRDRDREDAAAVGNRRNPCNPGWKAPPPRGVGGAPDPARKLLRLGMAREAYRTAAAHGQRAPGEPRRTANSSPASSPCPARRPRHGRTALHRHPAGQPLGHQPRPQLLLAAAAPPPHAAMPRRRASLRRRRPFPGLLRPARRAGAGRGSARLSARIAAAPAPPITAASTADFAVRDVTLAHPHPRRSRRHPPRPHLPAAARGTLE